MIRTRLVSVRLAIQVTALVMAVACRPAEAALAGNAVSTLGAPDGYVFAVSPFNCFLGRRQVEALNALAARTRRSGVILASGGAAVDDATAAAAVGALGIRMRTRRLAGSAIGRELNRLGWNPPVVIAIRHGAVVGVLTGEQAQTLDTWIAWLEGQPVRP